MLLKTPRLWDAARTFASSACRLTTLPDENIYIYIYRVFRNLWDPPQELIVRLKIMKKSNINIYVLSIIFRRTISFRSGSRKLRNTLYIYIYIYISSRYRIFAKSSPELNFQTRSSKCESTCRGAPREIWKRHRESSERVLPRTKKPTSNDLWFRCTRINENVELTGE